MWGAEASSHVRAVRDVPAPRCAASGRKPVSALRAALISFLIAELAYAFFLRFVYGRLL